MKKNFVYLGLITILLALNVSCNSDATVSDTMPEDSDAMDDDADPVVENTAGIGQVRDISSFDLVSEMGVGWNLGNSFDVTARDKTFWGNPLPTEAIIDQVAQRGFRTIRIPITWGPHQEETAPFTIESAYLDRINTVVDYAFENQMHVIINVHHDNDWANPVSEASENARERLGSLWTQVANRFEIYNDSLLFEVLNEPREEGSPLEWQGGTLQGRAYVNQYTKAALDAIRATGGNNENRHVMVPTWAASTIPVAMDDLVVPNNDPKVIISLHTYFPWPFAGQAEEPWGSAQDRAELEAEFDRIRNKWIVEEQRPVILGEWGSIADNDINQRLDYSNFYVSEAAKRGLLTVVWDDGGMFGMFDRHALQWPFGNIADVIVDAP